MEDQSGASTSNATVNRGNHFTWTEAHNVLLCREILLVQPFQFRSGTRDSGKAWETVANHLNSLSDITPRFNVNQRIVRDRFRLLESAFKRKMSQEERASGISPEISELDVLLEEIVEMSKGPNQDNDASEAKKREAAKEKITAEEMRSKAMETFGETNRRKAVSAEGGEPSVKRKRGNGGDTLSYLREKSGEEMELRRREVDLRAAELDAAQRKHDDNVKQQTTLINIMQQQHEQMFRQLQHQQEQQQAKQEEQQQQMQQILLAVMNSQQQQQQMIMSFLDKKKD